MLTTLVPRSSIIPKPPYQLPIPYVANKLSSKKPMILDVRLNPITPTMVSLLSQNSRIIVSILSKSYPSVVLVHTIKMELLRLISRQCVGLLEQISFISC